MRTRFVSSGVLGLAIVGSLLSPQRVASAKEAMDEARMIGEATTRADHEKLAAHYEAEAKKARAEAERHRKMAEAYRKAGGPIVSKLHFDEHCDAIVKSYTMAADEYDALATGEREMAKEMKK